MMASSVVPGLPNRVSTPSEASSRRKAARPLIGCGTGLPSGCVMVVIPLADAPACSVR